MRTTSWRAVLAASLLIPLAACGGASSEENTAAVTPGSAAFPMTIENCGTDVTVEAAPERILLVNSDEVANLEALGAIDRVVAVTAELQEGLYQDATYQALGDLDLLTTETNSTGGSVVSQESILAATPDLVIAPENAVDRAALASAGIPVYVPSAYCNTPGPELSQTATFDRVWSEVTTLGGILGLDEQAEKLVAEAQDQLSSTPEDAGSAAALYVASGGATLSPYGAPSMVTPVFEAAGLSNVYAETDERVFDVNIEDLMARDPQTIVLLTSVSEAETREAFLSSAGVDDLSAVKNDRVVVLAFPYTDPPSMLSTKGPQQLSSLLAELGCGNRDRRPSGDGSAGWPRNRP
ncbi:ABC transporter substrate-binding protein [Kineosporia babensis]|uniref:ABC transporter substrate-binding protein n=1 Tax=Kineosporia babensis TaxID=499548 RepID=A0A9X1NGV4_9ACTN|nr:ABC transporter substrate-binding protein [Kineosporia babensis]MCD5313913.1 ABC transporter substrate-binding protein [Kineosporia babensis]